jgi:serine/threonine-protein kinase
VLYEMLTGKPAFLGEDVTSTLARVLEVGANLSALPTGVPPAVRRTLELCLEKDVRKRIADMRDVKLALAGTFATDAQSRPISRLKLPVAFAAVALLAGAAVWLVKPVPPAAPAPIESAPTLPVSRFVITPPETAPLASLGGAQVAISPDGKRIAYFAEKPEKNGDVELYVRELDALEARPIQGTAGRSIGNMNLFFSPDGRSIGYLAPERGVISVTTDGRPSVKMFDAPSPAYLGATWAPDNTIIYSSGDRLQRVSAGGGGSPEPLMPAKQGGGVAAPVLLPGGRAVLFHAVDGGNDFVDLLDLETGKEKRLVEGGANPIYVDSGHIVFARGTTLMAVPFKASELTVTGEPVALIQGVRRTPGGATHFSLSATGTLVYEPTTANSESEGLSALVWVDRKGAIVDRALSDLVANPRDPRLSPDGTRLLLVTGAYGDGDLWNYDLGGRPPIPLALPGDNRFPVWSPDGTIVAFARVGLSPEIFTVPADGSVLTPHSLRGGMPVGVPHVWSDAGELILTRNASNQDIVAVPASATGDVRPIAASEFAEYDPALSPNGRWLAYVSDRTGSAEIWVQGYPDGVPVRVSRNGGYEPQWSRDGRELFYLQDNAMMAVAVKTESVFSFETPVQLFSSRYLTLPSPQARTYDVARDGRFLMISLGDQRTAAAPRRIVVVQNFGEELKQRVRPSGK